MHKWNLVLNDKEFQFALGFSNCGGYREVSECLVASFDHPETGIGTCLPAFLICGVWVLESICKISNEICQRNVRRDLKYFLIVTQLFWRRLLFGTDISQPDATGSGTHRDFTEKVDQCGKWGFLEVCFEVPMDARFQR